MNNATLGWALLGVLVIVAIVGLAIHFARASKKAPLTNGTSSKLNILFIGDSFTFKNHMYKLAAFLAGANVDADIQDSTSLNKHLQQGDIQPYLNQTKYDIIILQDQSTLPLTNPDQLVQNVSNVVSLIRSSPLNQGARVLLYQTWAHCFSDPWYASNPGQTVATAQATIDADFAKAAAANQGVGIVPVGDAFFKFRQTGASSTMDPLILNCTADDPRHPNAYGSFLAALMFYQAFTGQKVQATPAWIQSVLGSLSSDLTSTYQGLDQQRLLTLAQVAASM